MSVIPFACDVCNAGASSYKIWLVHLTTEKHQANLQQNQDLVEIELSHPSVRDKAVLVSRIVCSTPLMDVGSYFSKWGILKNLIYRGQEETFGIDDGGAGGGEPTMHCVLVYESEDAVREVTAKLEHSINGNVSYVQRMYSDGSESADYLKKGCEDSQYNGEVGALRGNGQLKPSLQAQTSQVKMDLGEFQTDKQKNVFENANEYQRMAVQMKDDLSDLKLEEQVDSFCQLLCLTSEQMQKRVDLGSQLLDILQTQFPECSIYPFGLDFIGVSSDIDTMNGVVDPFGKMGENYGAMQAIMQKSQTSLTVQVFDLLKQQQYQLRFCRDVEIKWIPWAFSKSKIQRISFVHRDSGVLCNLVIENFIIVQESRLLKFLSNLDPRVHSLLCFIRFFGSVYNTLQSPSDCFINQAMVWLMFHFLTLKNIVPKVNDLLSLSAVPLVVENTDISFCKDKEIIKYKTAPFMDDASIRSYSTLSLLHEFFQYFATENLKQNVICPVIGQLVPVTEFGIQIGGNFPSEIHKRYIFNYDGTTKQRRFYSGSPMGLQNPLDLSTNLTENVPLLEVDRFQTLCSRAAITLGEILESGNGEIMGIFIDVVKSCAIEVGEKIFVPLESQSESSESEDEELPMEVQEAKEDSSYELDYDAVDEDDEDTNQYIKKARIRMSQMLKKFFERAVNQAMVHDEEKLSSLDLRRKFQLLWLQYLIEFNSRFWAECFGFTVEAYAYQKVAPEEYSKTGELLASLSLKEIFDLIKTDEQGYGLDFRCELTDKISNLLYRKKLWKPKYLRAQLRPLWSLLTKNATSKTQAPEETENVTRMINVSFQNRFEFRCKLEVIFDMREEVPGDGKLGTSAKLELIDESFGRGKKNRATKLRFLVEVYEKLAMKYINLRVKQWLAYSCKELEYPKFDSAFKKLKKKQKGHPKWKKFRRKWKLLGRSANYL